jgi:pyruvate formate lyase activating enzyme
MDGLVFDIQRFSIHDGPGIRTTVFMQGCNLRCFWCHNPESQSPVPQVQFMTDKCILCAKCVEVCPQHAQLILDGKRLYLRDLCRTCGTCVATCFAGALVIKGRRMTVEQVMAEVDRDAPYYDDSKGGVTFSGGEPALQKGFLLTLLQASRQRGYHTAVDTAANVPWSTLQALLPWTSLFLVDLKALESTKHVRGTRVSNRRILRNLSRLVASRASVWVRIPVIPGFNDDAAEIGQMAAFLADLDGVQKVELLPFHHLGAGKYDSLGLDYPSKSLTPPTADHMQALLGLLAEKGLNVVRPA